MKQYSNIPRAGFETAITTLVIFLCIKMKVHWTVIGLTFLVGWLVNILIAVLEYYITRKQNSEDLDNRGL